jgi:uncharacterized protein YkwD
LGEVASPDQGTDPDHGWATVRTVTSAYAAAPVRLLAFAVATVAILLSLGTGRADGAEHAWSALLAPEGACRNADDQAAPAVAQSRAVTCLLNWARVQDGRARLAQRSALRQAAEVKVRRVAACGELSHTPCGAPVTLGVNASGYRYASFGENLFAGTWGQVSAREVVASWLSSPPHRANILRSLFRHVGVAPVRAPGLLEGTDAVVWAATFASPR